MQTFLNDKYEVLKLLYDNRIDISNEFIVISTQDTIARKLHFGKGKVNKIINELLDLEYLDSKYKVKGSYKLTNKTIVFFETIKKAGEIFNDRI